MDPETKAKMEEILRVSGENNLLLKHLRRAQKAALVMRLLYWFAIIGAGVGMFYFLQPYIESITGFVGDAGEAVDSFENFSPRKIHLICAGRQDCTADPSLFRRMLY